MNKTYAVTDESLDAIRWRDARCAARGPAARDRRVLLEQLEEALLQLELIKMAETHTLEYSRVPLSEAEALNCCSILKAR